MMTAKSTLKSKENSLKDIMLHSYATNDLNSSPNVLKPKKKLVATFAKLYQTMTCLRIEPVMSLFMFSVVLNGTCLANFIMDKGCLSHFHYDEVICKDIFNESYTHERTSLEKLANTYNFYLNLLTPISAFIVIYIAPWSDKNGHKPLLVYGLAGFVLSDIAIVFCTVYFESRLEYIILANLPSHLTGGFIGIMMVLNSLISETSTQDNRSLRYTFLQIAFELGVTLGALVGGFLYKTFGYLTVFSTMTVGHLLAIVWVMSFVPETQRPKVQAGLQKKFRHLCSSSNFTSGLKICLKSREHGGRRILWLLLLSGCCITTTYMVYTNINYVYTHHLYKWDPSTYSQYWAIFSFSEMIVSLVFNLIVIKVFKFSDPAIGLIGSVSVIGKNMFMAFASDLWLYYMSNIFGYLHSLSNLAIKSIISKLVLEDEIGQVFSFLTTCESIVPLFGSALTFKIFNLTLNNFAGTCYITATFFLLLPLGTFVYIFCFSRSISESTTEMKISHNDS